MNKLVDSDKELIALDTIVIWQTDKLVETENLANRVIFELRCAPQPCLALRDTAVVAKALRMPKLYAQGSKCTEALGECPADTIPANHQPYTTFVRLTPASVQ